MRPRSAAVWRPSDPTARICLLFWLFSNLFSAGRCAGGFPFLRMLGVVAVPACLHSLPRRFLSFLRRQGGSPRQPTRSAELVNVHGHRDLDLSAHPYRV